jgi:hypothetical protein
VLHLVDVLDPDQLDEVRVGVVVVKGDLRQAADGRDRVEMIEPDDPDAPGAPQPAAAAAARASTATLAPKWPGFLALIINCS